MAMTKEQKIAFLNGFLALLRNEDFAGAQAFLDSPVGQDRKPLRDKKNKVISAPTTEELADILMITINGYPDGEEHPAYFCVIANSNLNLIRALTGKLPNFFREPAKAKLIQEAIRRNQVIGDDRNALYTELGVSIPPPPSSPPPHAASIARAASPGRRAASPARRAASPARALSHASNGTDEHNGKPLVDNDNLKCGDADVSKSQKTEPQKREPSRVYIFFAIYWKRILLGLLIGGALAALFVTPFGQACLLAIGLGKLVAVGAVAIYEAVGAGIGGFILTFFLRTLISRYELGKKLVSGLAGAGQFLSNLFAKVSKLSSYVSVIGILALLGVFALVGVILQGIGTFFGKMVAWPVEKIGHGAGEIVQWLLSPLLLVLGAVAALGYFLRYPYRVFVSENNDQHVEKRAHGLLKEGRANDANDLYAACKEIPDAAFPRYRVMQPAPDQEKETTPAQKASVQNRRMGFFDTAYERTARDTGPKNLAEWGAYFMEWSHDDLRPEAALKAVGVVDSSVRPS